MADKPSAPSDPRHLSTILFWILMIAFFFSGFYTVITSYLNIDVNFDSAFMSGFKRMLVGLFNTIQFISLFITLLFIMGVIYVKFRFSELKRLEKTKQKVDEITKKRMQEKPEANKKWLKVTEHASSSNPSDWRLAILEADILLDELLDKLGYKAPTLGEKLKSVSPNNLKTLDNAWEAHKVRNSIAHQGSEFDLNQREARRVIALYESVFKECYYI